ncbi:MAG: hypothetical protein K0B52_01105 [FCB group bacterium]|nr:hypothetical protein [FCB group bacterium]
MESPETQIPYEMNIPEQINVLRQDPLSNNAISLHTRQGIRHIRIKDIHYIDLNHPVDIIIHHADNIERIPRADVDYFHITSVTLPDRKKDAPVGSVFMRGIADMGYKEREAEILREICGGNIPDISREFITCRSRFADAKGTVRTLEYDVMSDYLSIGTNADYCRIPMGPQTAQTIADSFNCILPTQKLSDDIWKHAFLRMKPIVYKPEGNRNELVRTFIEHNRDINADRDAAGGQVYELIAGIKKDIVICNALKNKPGYVAIYGWHNTDGSPVQPLYTGHIDTYVDYSHGVRLINAIMRVDGKSMHAHDILRDPVLYKLLSDENGVMEQPYYQY